MSRELMYSLPEPEQYDLNGLLFTRCGRVCQIDHLWRPLDVSIAASGDTILGTLPERFRPLYSNWAHQTFQDRDMELLVKNTGEVAIQNHSNASVGAGTYTAIDGTLTYICEGD